MSATEGNLLSALGYGYKMVEAIELERNKLKKGDYLPQMCVICLTRAQAFSKVRVR